MTVSNYSHAICNHSNLRTIVNTIGNDRLHLRGSRVLQADSERRDNMNTYAYKRPTRSYGETQTDRNYYKNNRDSTYDRDYTSRNDSDHSYHRSHSNNSYSSRPESAYRSRNRRKWSCGFWNAMGWAQGRETDSYILRKELVTYLDLDIIGIAETHLMNEKLLEIDGYTWFGNNRKNIHIKAKKGSGGVGFLIRNDLSRQFNIMIEDDSVEGILWLKFVSKSNNTELHTCVCYLPPIDSTRNVDANEFFDNLICQMHEYCKNATFYICGDFNARCSNFQDFIEGVDNIQDRNVVDFSSNKFGELLCDFLIDSNCCMLNGRNIISNDYTCIKSQGTSVVDYCLVAHEDIVKFTDFSVRKITDLMNEIDIIDSIEPGTSIPDHSFLTWKYEIGVAYKVENNPNNGNKIREFTKFSREIPTDFLNGILDEVRQHISNIESNIHNQSDADEHNTKFVNLLRNEMFCKVSHKNIIIKDGQSNKKDALKSRGGQKTYRYFGMNYVIKKGLCYEQKRIVSKRKGMSFLHKESFLIGKSRKPNESFGK